MRQTGFQFNPMQPRQSSNMGNFRPTFQRTGQFNFGLPPMGAPQFGITGPQQGHPTGGGMSGGVHTMQYIKPQSPMMPGSRGNVFDPTGAPPPMIQDPNYSLMPPQTYDGFQAPQGMDDLELFKQRFGTMPNPTRMAGPPGFQFPMFGGR